MVANGMTGEPESNTDSPNPRRRAKQAEAPRTEHQNVAGIDRQQRNGAAAVSMTC